MSVPDVRQLPEARGAIGIYVRETAIQIDVPVERIAHFILRNATTAFLILTNMIIRNIFFYLYITYGKTFVVHTVITCERWRMYKITGYIIYHIIEALVLEIVYNLRSFNRISSLTHLPLTYTLIQNFKYIF